MRPTCGTSRPTASGRTLARARPCSRSQCCARGDARCGGGEEELLGRGSRSPSRGHFPTTPTVSSFSRPSPGSSPFLPVSGTQPTGTSDMLVLRRSPTRLVRSTRAFSVLAPPSSPPPQDLLSRYRSEVDSGRLQWQDDQARTIVQVNPLPLSLLPIQTFLTTSRPIDSDLFFVTRAASTRPPTSVVLHSQPSPPLHSSPPPPPSSTSTNPLLLAIQAHPSTVRPRRTGTRKDPDDRRRTEGDRCSSRCTSDRSSRDGQDQIGSDALRCCSYREKSQETLSFCTFLSFPFTPLPPGVGGRGR